MQDDYDMRAELARRGFSQSSFARFLAEHGDYRSFPTILRSVANWCAGKGPPGEIRVVLTLFDLLQIGRTQKRRGA